MGAGSGIDFEIDLEYHSYPFVWNSISHRLEMAFPERQKIDRFSAWDYMYGMDNIRGDLLKITACVIQVDKEDYIYLLDAMADEGSVELSVTFGTGENKWFQEWMFGGFTRGRWQNCFPFELKATGTLDWVGDYQVVLTVEPVSEAEFDSWYRDVFETYSSGLEDERYQLEKQIRALIGKGDPGDEELENLREELDGLETEEQWWDKHCWSLRINYGKEAA